MRNFKFTLFSNISQIYEPLHQFYFKHKNITSSCFTKEIFNFKIIVIIEPFHIQSKYATISPIWKRYLAKNLPNTKLIIMGFIDYQSKNYIDLLNLPKDFNAYLQNGLPVSADWEIPIDGADMLEYLKRFFAGHGGNSLLSKLNQLKQSVNTAHTQIVSGVASFKEVWGELLLPYAKPEWQELINRWQNYYPYFEYLPFYPAMQEINQKFSEISEIFTCNIPPEKLFLKSDIDSTLTHIHQRLTEIDKLYIRPEIYKEFALEEKAR